MTSWLLLDSGRCDAAFNMALDEALLEGAARLTRPVLRFYGWTGPAATFGYFQRHAEIERLTLLRPLVRRPTAGGLVPHDADWTYAIAVPPGHEWHSLTAMDSYRRVHEWIQSAFRLSGIGAELAPQARHAGPGQCFVGHEKFDLLLGGRKVAGAAQRRNRCGLLIQGSVQPPPAGLVRSDWQGKMCAAAGAGDVEWIEWEPDATLIERANELVRRKYSQAAYNEKR